MDNEPDQALLNELQANVDDFLKAMCTTRKIAITKPCRIDLDPFTAAAYEKFDGFITSIDNIIKWYETKNEQHQATINTLLKGIAACADGTDEHNARVQKTINEQKDTIAVLNQRVAQLEAKLQKTVQNDALELQTIKNIASEMEKQLVDSTKNYKGKIKALEEEIVALKIENDELQTKATASHSGHQNNTFVELKDVIVSGTQIDYKYLTGKVLILDKVHYFKSQYCIAYYDNGGKECSVQILLNDSFKIYLNGTLGPVAGDCNELFDDCLEYIHRFELKILRLCKSRISFNRFLALIKSRTIERLVLTGIVIKDQKKGGALEKVWEYLPNLKEFDCTFLFDTENCREETVSNLLKLPTFKNLQKFSLSGCSHEFNLEAFGEFMHKHPWVKFSVSIACPPARKETINKLQADKEAIIFSWPESSPKPFIQIRS